MEKQETYGNFLRKRISELIEQRDISEHFLSLELGKSGSYIRAITSGRALPSMAEFFNIVEYFNIEPAEFFAGAGEEDVLRMELHKSIRSMERDKLEKLAMIIDLINGK